MLNEFVYCPRLFYFMHVEGKWEDNVYTLKGTEAHRRVDRKDQLLPDPKTDKESPAEEGDAAPTIARSVSLSSTTLGLVAKLDLVETTGDIAIPVDTKRGRVPQNDERSNEPERVQLMAQALLLREHGYRTTEGVLYLLDHERASPFRSAMLSNRRRSSMLRGRVSLRPNGRCLHRWRTVPMQWLFSCRHLPSRIDLDAASLREWSCIRCREKRPARLPQIARPRLAESPLIRAQYM